MASTCTDCWVKEEITPPKPHDYTPRGTWKTINDLNTYTTGPSTANRAIVLIYDIFGVSPQILQGADRLAHHLKALVFLPDYFKGAAPSHEEYMKDPASNLPKLRSFMKAEGDFTQKSAETLSFVEAAKGPDSYPDVEAWGVFGLCWGGKVAVLASIHDRNPFKVSGQAHPGGLNAEDARAMTVPHVCLASKDESAEVVAEYEKILEEKKLGEVQTFASSVHGWMGARAELEDEEQRSQYERGYAEAARFLDQHL